MRIHLAPIILSAAVVLGAGATSAHADPSQGTDACLNGVSTVISGMKCSPESPTAAEVCAKGTAHTTNGADYCPPPAVVTVGEFELGTAYVPKLTPPTRLDVAMAKTSLQSMRFRCARLGGARLVFSTQFRRWICRDVPY